MSRKSLIPRISIITPSYNQGQFLEETINSVLDQHYPNLEYIIIDGGSTDGSPKIIKKYDRYLSHWISEKDRGQSHAINKGLVHTTGDIISWLNSDDYYEANALHEVADLFQNHKASAVCGRTRIIDNVTNSRILPQTYVNHSNFIDTVCECHIEQPSTFFSAREIKAIGPLTEELHFVMDKELWLKFLFLFGTKNVVVSESIFSNFRHHSASKTMSGMNKFYRDYATILYALAIGKNLGPYAEFLQNNFTVNYEYRFTHYIQNKVATEVIEKMTIFFLLHTASLIYQRTDFEYARRVSRFLQGRKIDFSEKAILRNKEIDNLVTSGWLLFRLRRKLQYLKS